MTDLCFLALVPPEELVAAQATAACAAWALEGASGRLLAAIASEEAQLAISGSAADPRLPTMLDGTEFPDADDSPPASYTVVHAMLNCVDQSGPDEAISRALDHGTVTGMVAALIGGLVCCRLDPQDLPWPSDDTPAALFTDLVPLAAGLATRRTAPQR